MPVVEVFKALENGSLRQIGLSAEQVKRLCPESVGQGWAITSETVEVLNAYGDVLMWPSGREHVHWLCPHCQQVHISDFYPGADSNPVLWLCEGGNGLMCLVHWKRK